MMMLLMLLEYFCIKKQIALNIICGSVKGTI